MGLPKKLEVFYPSLEMVNLSNFIGASVSEVGSKPKAGMFWTTSGVEAFDFEAFDFSGGR